MASKGMTTQLMNYLKVRKKFWLVPVLGLLLLVGLLLALAQGSALAPFIYTIF